MVIVVVVCGRSWWSTPPSLLYCTIAFLFLSHHILSWRFLPVKTSARHKSNIIKRNVFYGDVSGSGDSSPSTSNTVTTSTATTTATTTTTPATATTINNTATYVRVDHTTHHNSTSANAFTITNTKSHLNFEAVLRKCRSTGDYTAAIDLAEKALQLNPMPPSVMTKIIKIFGESGNLGRAISMVKVMKDQLNILPNEHHMGALIQACRISGQYEMALALFGQMDGLNIPKNTIICNIMISTLGDALQLHSVVDILEEMTQRNIAKDIVTYSASITACVKAGNWQQAVMLYRSMTTEGLSPNTVALNAVLSACAHGRELKQALDLFAEACRRGMMVDTITYSVLIALCGDLKEFDLALSLFCAMDGPCPPSPPSPPVSPSPTHFEDVPWNLLRRQSRLRSDDHDRHYSSSFMEGFLSLCPKVRRDTGCFTAMVTACERSGRWREALALVEWMDQRSRRRNSEESQTKEAAGEQSTPSPPTSISTSVSTSPSQQRQSRQQQRQRTPQGQQQMQPRHWSNPSPDAKIYSAAISCCGKAGCWMSALHLFRAMDERGVRKDAAVYYAMIAALQNAAQAKRMQELKEGRTAAATTAAAATAAAASVPIPSSSSSSSSSLASILLDYMDEEAGTAVDASIPWTSQELFREVQSVYAEGLTRGFLQQWRSVGPADGGFEVGALGGEYEGSDGRGYEESDTTATRDVIGGDMKGTLDGEDEGASALAGTIGGVAVGAVGLATEDAEGEAFGANGLAAQRPAVGYETGHVYEGGEEEGSGRIEGSSADESAGQTTSVLSMEEEFLPPRVLDLHGFPLPVAKAAVDFMMEDLRVELGGYHPTGVSREAKLFSELSDDATIAVKGDSLPVAVVQSVEPAMGEDEGKGNGSGGNCDVSGKSRAGGARTCPFDLHVITGRGRHVNNSGTRGVLRSEIREYISETYGGMVAMPAPGNDGCLVIPRSEVTKWVLGNSKR